MGGYGGINDGIMGTAIRIQLLFLCFEGVAEPVPRKVTEISEEEGKGMYGT